jgi:hypothetical protein
MTVSTDETTDKQLLGRYERLIEKAHATDSRKEAIRLINAATRMRSLERV